MKQAVNLIRQMANFTFKGINHLWRWLCTCFGFISFALGGLTLYLTVFQLVRISSSSKTASEQKVRKIISSSFNNLLNVLEYCGVIRVETDGLKGLSDLRGTLIISNHPCLLDVVIIMAKLPNCQCVVKNELWSSPFLGGVMRAAGFICNNIDPMLFLEECKKELSSGQNIIIFPEGTRSTPGQKITMQRGIGNLALAADADIQALAIRCKPLTLTKEDKWYTVPPEKVVLKLAVKKKFFIKDYSGIEARSLRVRRLMKELHQYYNGCIEIE